MKLTEIICIAVIAALSVAAIYVSYLDHSECEKKGGVMLKGSIRMVCADVKVKP